MDNKNVVSLGYGYRFRSQEDLITLPAGIYFPATSDHFGFYLSTIKVKSDEQLLLDDIFGVNKRADHPIALSTHNLPSSKSRRRKKGLFDNNPAVDPDHLKKLNVSEAHLKKYIHSRMTEFNNKGISAASALKNIEDFAGSGDPNLSPSELSEELQEFNFIDEAYFDLQEYNEGLKAIDSEIKMFLNNKEWYTKNQIAFRRSILAFGPPGTGKTQYISYISDWLVDNYDAIVIRIEHANHIWEVKNNLKVIDKFLGDRLKIFVIEELGEFFGEGNELKNALLNLLDTTISRRNTLFILTTNFPENIPENIIDRPSRLDLVVEIDITKTYEFVRDWYVHLRNEDFPVKKDEPWLVEAMKILSPAYWKELFIFSHLQNKTLEQSYEVIKIRKKLIKNRFQNKTTVGF